MLNFGTFLANNWLLIVSILVSVICFVFALIRKQPKEVVNRWTELLFEIGNFIPQLVINAETAGIKDKKNFVIVEALKLAKQLNNNQALTDFQKVEVIQVADKLVELILTAPTKKGGIGREESK